MRIAAFLLFTAALLAGDDVPGWVRQAAAVDVPAYPARVTMVTLLNDANLTIGTDGLQTSTEHGVVKVLQGARKAPYAYCRYNPKTGKVRTFRAWLLPPDGRAIVYGKNAIVDFSLSDKYEYDEDRARLIEASGGLAPGTIFAWEIVEEEKTPFPADEHFFQDSNPVLVSRYSLSLPAGWVPLATLFNHEAQPPQVSGSTYTWELRNLPWIEPEVHSPGFLALVPRLGLNYGPEDSSAAKPVKTWRDISQWHTAQYDPASAVTDAIRRKAAELIAASNTELDRIRAIASFVQKTNYVAVEINLAHSGGYTPHAADQVLARHYGDCKDKATLMRALLKAAGIEAYPVAIYYGGRHVVRPEWPSPYQFNHAIVAVRVSPGTMAPTIIEHPKLGRLLIFDPTDPVTPVGDLPGPEQGSHALVIAGADGDLLTMPMLPPNANRADSVAEATLAPDGSLAAHLHGDYFGQMAASLRHLAFFEKHEELTRTFEEQLSSRLGGLTLQKIEPADQAQNDEFQLNMDIAVRQFGQALQGRLLMISPGALGHHPGYSFPARTRAAPVQLEAESFRDSVSITVPEQFKVDELPDPVTVTSPYGTYKAKWQAEGPRVRFEQSMEVNSTLAPAADYDKVRRFFEKVDSAQRSSVVLVK